MPWVMPPPFNPIRVYVGERMLWGCFGDAFAAVSANQEQLTTFNATSSLCVVFHVMAVKTFSLAWEVMLQGDTVGALWILIPPIPLRCFTKAHHLFGVQFCIHSIQSIQTRIA